MTREEAQKLLGEVLTKLKYNRPQHVHVSEVEPRDCEAMYDKLILVEKYINMKPPESPTLRQLAQTFRYAAQEKQRTDQVVSIGCGELQLLCDAVLAYTVP